MASIRDLKKEINTVTSEIITEAYVRKMLFDTVSEENLKEIIQKALNLRNDLINRANHPDGKDSPKHVKTYFQKVRSDMQEKFSELAEEVNQLK
jgi:DNA repair photolyase